MGTDGLFAANEYESTIRSRRSVSQRGGYHDFRAMVPTHCIQRDRYRAVHYVPAAHAQIANPRADNCLFVNDFPTAVEAIRADIMPQMRFTGSRVDRQRLWLE
jgi:hypothetical protein